MQGPLCADVCDSVPLAGNDWQPAPQAPCVPVSVLVLACVRVCVTLSAPGSQAGGSTEPICFSRICVRACVQA
jgi:hypothetical protein